MSVSAKPAREPFQLPERATAEPRQSAPLRCQCRWLECGLRPLLPPVLAPFSEVKVEVWQNERKQVCSSPSSGLPCVSPPIRKLKMWSWGAQKSHTQWCLLVNVWKSHKYTLAEYGEHSWRRAFYFFQDLSPLKLSENCFGSQEMVEAILSQMANAKSFRNTIRKNVLWLSLM